MKALLLSLLAAVGVQAQLGLDFGDPVSAAHEPLSLTDGLLVRLEMEDASNPATDSQGDYDFYELGGTFSFQDAKKKLGSYCLTNTVDGTLVLTNSSAALVTAAGGSFTATLWVYPQNTNVSAAVMGRYDTGGNKRSWHARIQDTGLWRLYYSTDGSTSTDTDASGPQAAIAWTFVAVVWDNVYDRIRMSINGGAFTDLAVTGDLYESTSAAPLTVGGYLNSGGASTSKLGSYDQFLYYNRALSLDEIGQLYNSGSGYAF